MLLIKGKPLALPLLQGGMGVGVSMGGLAGAVAACGGMGTISTADAGFNEPDFDTDAHAANLRVLRREIAKAKKIAKGVGLVAVNAMTATRQYAEAVRTAAAAGADAVVCGAGLPLDLPGLVKGFDTAIAPIVSSARAAKLILKTWDKHHAATADFVVVEGCLAGGHLGFDEQDLRAGRCRPLEQIVPEVLEAVAPYAQKYGHDIPVFAAGGLYSGQDIARFTRLGAAGGQLATRFILTDECDAAPAYKQTLLAAKPEDIRIIHSPVGMPGRALNTPLVQRIEAGCPPKIQYCWRCIKGCSPAEAPFCITKALIEAVRGNVEDGLFFCGGNAGRADAIVPVRKLIDQLMKEWRQFA